VNNFFSTTAAEILGIFVPGQIPIVKANAYLPLDVVAVHEQGHKQLCQATGFGRYMGMLALAGPAKSRYAEQAERALAECIEQCWLVQEGYATMRQVAYLISTGGEDEVAAFEKNLPQSYKHALACFPTYPDCIDLQARIWAGKWGGQYSFDAEIFLKAIAREFSSYVLAKSAMSIPISCAILQAESLPCYDVSLAVRRNCPDSRLLLLAMQFSAEFIWRCVEESIEGIREMNSVGKMRPLDERLECMVVQLCKSASLPYEASDVVSLNEIGSRMGMAHVKMQELDERDISLKVSQNYQRPNVVVAPEFKLKYVSMDVAREVMLEHFRQFSAEETSVVCEIGPKGDDGIHGVWFHFFVGRDAAFHTLNKIGDDKRSELVARSHSNAAFRTMLCGVRFEPDMLKTIPEKVPHNTWSWLFPYNIIKTSPPQLDVAGLQAVGEVYAVGLASLGMHLTSVVSFRIEPSLGSFPALVCGGEIPLHEGFSGKFEIPLCPERLTLLVGKDDDDLRVVRLSTTDRHLCDRLPSSSFEQNSIVETLSFGLNSMIVSLISLRQV